MIIFYGSQTGTAEDYASRLAKEGAQRFGLRTMTVDVEDCDMTLLDVFPSNSIAFFCMATYGSIQIIRLFPLPPLNIYHSNQQINTHF